MVPTVVTRWGIQWGHCLVSVNKDGTLPACRKPLCVLRVSIDGFGEIVLMARLEEAVHTNGLEEFWCASQHLGPSDNNVIS